MAPFNSGRSSGTTTIANNTKVSDAIDTLGGYLAGVIFPATMTSTTLTFTVSNDGVTYVALTDTAGSAISYTFAASKGFALPVAVFGAWAYVKLNVDSNEGAARSITYILKGS